MTAYYLALIAESAWWHTVVPFARETWRDLIGDRNITLIEILNPTE